MLSDRDYMQTGKKAIPWVVRLPESLVKPLIATTAIFFVLSGMGEHDGSLMAVELHPHFIRRLQVWRLVTYMFAHANLMHLVVNMWGLYVFGRPLERTMGPKRFAALYFTSGIVGGLVWLVANWSAAGVVLDHAGRITQIYGGVIGASGAVFGVMMAAAMRFPNERILLLFPPVALRLKTFVAGYALIEVFMALSRGGGRVAHIAHLGGILGGFIYMRGQRRSNGTSASFGDMLRNLFSQVSPPHHPPDASQPPPPPPSSEPSQGQEVPGLTTEVDRILDKIGRSGLNSLTPQERQTLEQARQRFRDRR